MLVLTRRELESLVMDGRIRITVLKIAGGRVRFGVTAPKEVRILRGELADKEEATVGAPLVGAPTVLNVPAAA